MSDEAFWRLKVHAFLHDPPEKALVLFEGGHAARGRELAERLVGPAPSGVEDAIRDADHLASAADREALLLGAPPLRWREQPVLRHPLSGDTIDLAQWGSLGDPGPARAAVDSAMERLTRELDGSGGLTPERAFWGLWRLLPEFLANSSAGRDRLGRLWEYLPADTRMPDHSIWDHQRLVSALAPILWKRQTPALLLVTFGPVQGFIGTARRTADLWAGSFILSWLASRAIVPLVETCGPDAVLFPALWAQPLLDHWLAGEPLRLPVGDDSASKGVASLPNRFLAVVAREDTKDLGDRCAAALESAWKDLAGKTEQRLAEIASVATESLTGLFDRQARAHIEVHWGAFPWPRDLQACRALLQARLGDGAEPSEAELAIDGVRAYRPSAGALYGGAYRAVDATVGGVKASRVFTAAEEPGQKCSLCGVRQVAHVCQGGACLCGWRECKKWWADLEKRRLGSFRRGEALCAVCLTKRFAGETLRDVVGNRRDTPSTSEIAASAFKLAVLQPQTFGLLRSRIQDLVRVAGETRERLRPAEALRPVWRAASALGSDADIARAFAHIDGECFFEDEGSGNDLTAEGLPPEVVGAARALVQAAVDRGVEKPFPYLAVVRLDGDDMGRRLGGEREVLLGKTLHPDIESWFRSLGSDARELADRAAKMTPAAHAAITRACGAFSLRIAQAVVPDRLAYLVYAGGDDVLALAALGDALALARELRLAFGGHMEIRDGQEVKGFHVGRGFWRVRREPAQTFGHSAGLSGALVIFHHKHPLQAGVEESRRAEEWAKSAKGKDTLAITILRRSGQPTHCRLRWTGPGRLTEGEQTADAIEDLLALVAEIAAGRLSPSFLHVLKAFLERPDARTLPREAQKLLVEREIRRHWRRERNGRAVATGNSAADERERQTQVAGLIWSLRDRVPDADVDEWMAAIETAVFLARPGR